MARKSLETKQKLKDLKAIKFILESMSVHTSFNFMALHTLGYSVSLKDYFDMWRLKRDLKKLEKQIKKMECAK